MPRGGNESKRMGRKRRLANMSPGPTIDTLVGATPVREIDLHGYTASEAEARLRDFIFTCARVASGRVVRVITGKGKRSAGRPVLEPLVRHQLETGLSPYVTEFTMETGGGSYLVRIKSAA